MIPRLDNTPNECNGFPLQCQFIFGIDDMALAIFDLDNTLLAGDSDYLWGQYLVENGLVDAEFHAAENQRFYDEYLAGEMDITDFLTFQFKPFADNTMVDLQRWRADYLQQKIEPIILPTGEARIAAHREQGDTLLMITATNSFITAPIAGRLGIPNLIATEAEMHDGEYTGGIAGVPSYQQGKVTRLMDWLNNRDLDLENSTFYSDSHNDLPLLELVSNPIVVDADDKLRNAAKQNGWESISFRD